MVASNFNSIKVRLEQSANKLAKEKNKFQFHKGTIRTDGDDSWRIPIHHFNSIKVRLEQVTNPTSLRLLPFQFHKGTIRTFVFRITSF